MTAARAKAPAAIKRVYPPTGDPNPIYDNLKDEVRRNQMADQLEADALDPALGWWHRGVLRREARDLRGGVL